MDPSTLPPTGARLAFSVWTPALVVLAPKGKETVYLLDPGVFSIGRDPAVDLSLPDPLVSWTHARLRVFGNDERRAPRVEILDSDSTNGTWVNEVRITAPLELRERDLVRVGSFRFAFTVLDELRVDNAVRLVQWASADPLTGVLDRRSVERVLRVRMVDALRTKRPLSLVLLGVDRFRDVNHRWGRAHGDRVLQHVAARMEESVRHGDQVGRLGDDVFALVLAGTSLDDALEVAERVRAGVAGDGVSDGGPKVRVSAGVTSVPVASASTPEAVMEAAEAALRQAKADGRSCVRARPLGQAASLADAPPLVGATVPAPKGLRVRVGKRVGSTEG